MAKSQIQLNKNWADKNREHKRYLSKRSSARSFIRNDATEDDLNELTDLIKQRGLEIK